MRDVQAMKLFREPLLHFLLIGAAFFLYYDLFSDPGQDRRYRRNRVDAGVVATALEPAANA